MYKEIIIIIYMRAKHGKQRIRSMGTSKNKPDEWKNKVITNKHIIRYVDNERVRKTQRQADYNAYKERDDNRRAKLINQTTKPPLPYTVGWTSSYSMHCKHDKLDHIFRHHFKGALQHNMPQSNQINSLMIEEKTMINS